MAKAGRESTGLTMTQETSVDTDDQADEAPQENPTQVPVPFHAFLRRPPSGAAQFVARIAQRLAQPLGVARVRERDPETHAAPAAFAQSSNSGFTCGGPKGPVCTTRIWPR